MLWSCWKQLDLCPSVKSPLFTDRSFWPRSQTPPELNNGESRLVSQYTVRDVVLNCKSSKLTTWHSQFKNNQLEHLLYLWVGPDHENIICLHVTNYREFFYFYFFIYWTVAGRQCLMCPGDQPKRKHYNYASKMINIDICYKNQESNYCLQLACE